MVDLLTRRRRAAILPALGVAAALLLPSAASAAFPGANGPIVFHDDRSILTLDPAGGAPHRLPEDVAGFGGMSVSSNGLRIAYSAGHVISTMNIDGSAPKQLTSGDPFTDEPAWSPDGKHIAFERGYGIWVMDADGRNAHTITPNAGFKDSYSDPAWSPDGTRIAAAFHQQVWVMNADGTGAHALTAAEQICPSNKRTMSSAQPDWAPDGSHVVFTGPVTCAASRGTDIWSMAPDGSALTDLIGDDGSDDNSAVFSPDGTRIVFVRADGATSRLMTMGTGGAIVDPLAAAGDTADGPSWAVAYVPPKISETAKAHGRKLTVSGRVTPAATGRVRVTVKRGAKVVARRTAKLKHARYRVVVKASRTGSYRATATLLADPTHVSVTSKTRTARVRH